MRFLLGWVLFLSGSGIIVVWLLALWFEMAPREVAHEFARALTAGDGTSERASGQYSIRQFLLRGAGMREPAGRIWHGVKYGILPWIVVWAMLWSSSGGLWSIWSIALFAIALFFAGVFTWEVLGGFAEIVTLAAGSQSDVLGRAKWATWDLVSASGVFKRSDRGIYLGLFQHPNGTRTRQEISYHGDRHLLTVGPNRSGKGVGLIIPNLSTLRRSMVVLDPKGELAAITARKRRDVLGSEVVIFNPFAHLVESHPHLKGRGYNPLAGLDWRSSWFVDDAKGIAAALVEVKHGKNQFFYSQARELVGFLVMWVCFEHSRNLEKAKQHRADAFKSHFAGTRPSEAQAVDFLKKYDEANPPLKGYPDLRDVRWWLSEGLGSGGEGVETRALGITKLCRRVRGKPDIKNDPNDGVPEALKMLAGDFAGDVTNGLRDALQTARDDLGFLVGSEAMVESLTGPAFDFRQLRNKLTTVYIILPGREMASYARWLRLIVAVAFRQLQGEVSERMGSVLFVLDEFLQMGRMDTLLTNYDQAASLGVQLWPIVQHFTRFKALYGEEWQNFVSGAGVVCGLTPADAFTAKQLAILCGRTTVALPGATVDRVQGQGLALYDDLLRMAPGELLVFKRGSEPPLPGVPHPFKGYAPPYFEHGSRFNEGLDPRPIAVA